MMTDYLLLGAIGFLAQIVDGALGMAFGIVSNAALLTMGFPPAQASAIVHTAEVFTTAGSAASHIYHRNVDWRLVLRVGIAGVVGAVLGAWVLSNVDTRWGRPFIATYLLIMGVVILMRAKRHVPPRDTPFRWAPPVGLVGGFLDASGGGGWGPIVTSTLVGAGHVPRYVVGSVNLTEFFVTVATSATFIVTLGLGDLAPVIPLVLGGLVSAPFAGYLVKIVSHRMLMVMVGSLILLLSTRTLLKMAGLT